jgi:hypothetical protein
MTRPVVALAFGMGQEWVRNAIRSWELLHIYGPGGSREKESIVHWLKDNAQKKIGMSGLEDKLQKLRDAKD